MAVRPNRQLCLGFYALGLSNIVNFASRWTDTDLDFVTGLLFGLACGLLLLGIRRGRRGDSATTC
jgi:hypothetical protein